MSFSVYDWTLGQVSVFAAGPAAGPWMSPTRYYTGLAILSVLLVIAAVKAYRVWEEIHDDEVPDTPKDLLQTFEAAFAEGDLDAEELARVRARLARASAENASEIKSLSPNDAISEEM